MARIARMQWSFNEHPRDAEQTYYALTDQNSLHPPALPVIGFPLHWLLLGSVVEGLFRRASNLKQEMGDTDAFLRGSVPAIINLSS